MWSNGPFAAPVSSFEAPVPPVGIDPTGGPFVYVAINKSWLPYVVGSLLQLLLQTTWETSDVDVLAQSQQQAFNLINQFQIATDQCPPVIPITGDWTIDMTACEQLRFQNGKLQGLCCGSWSDIPGQTTQGVGGSPQPGSGEPQPKPGACQTYRAVMLANNQWIAPVGVSAGDIVTVSNPTGATHDGGYSGWQCWQGDTFFLGACIPSTGGPQAGDPWVAGKHMALTCIIAGVYYSCETPITVPSGVSNAQVIFQVNDSAIGDNYGSLAYDVQVCNNQAAHWSHTFDFALSPGGFVVYTVPDNAGQWLAGLGWSFTDITRAVGDYERGVNIWLTGIAAFICTEVRVTIDYAVGTLPAGNQQLGYGSFPFTNTVKQSILYPTLPNGTSLSYDVAGHDPVATGLYCFVNADEVYAPGAMSGNALVRALTVWGDGPEPVWP